MPICDALAAIPRLPDMPRNLTAAEKTTAKPFVTIPLTASAIAFAASLWQAERFFK